MAPLEPIPETVEAINELDPTDDPGEPLEHLVVALANRAQGVVPDLVGVSIARLQEGLTFTMVATGAEVAVLDAVQYLAGGPCVDGAHDEQALEFGSGDVLDEDRWQLFAAATAARTVRSTLTLPVMTAGAAIGTVNLYAASRRAFVGHSEELAAIFGAWAAGAIANADLSFRTRREAEAAPGRLAEQRLIDVAVGILAVHLGLPLEAAEARLHDAATRAGVSAVQLAKEILAAREHSDQDDE